MNLRRFTFIFSSLLRPSLLVLLSVSIFFGTKNIPSNLLQEKQNIGYDEVSTNEVEINAQENNESREFTCDDEKINPLWMS